MTVLRPITLGFILSAAFSSAKEVNWDLYGIIAFIASFYLLYKGKIGSIAIVFVFGILGILLTFYNNDTYFIFSILA